VRHEWGAHGSAGFRNKREQPPNNTLRGAGWYVDTPRQSKRGWREGGLRHWPEKLNAGIIGIPSERRYLKSLGNG
jgi:hypothetical protein